jgi:hypothetical protein
MEYDYSDIEKAWLAMKIKIEKDRNGKDINKEGRQLAREGKRAIDCLDSEYYSNPELIRLCAWLDERIIMNEERKKGK